MLILIIFILFFLLLCNPQIVLQNAANGLTLWYQSILPILLPFMIISYILSKVYEGKLKNPCFYAIFIGLCCGFPMGAIVISSLYKKQLLSSKDAYSLLEFCNISSPSFVLSYIYPMIQGSRISLFSYLVCIYGPVLIELVAFFLLHNRNQIPTRQLSNAQSTSRFSIELLDNALASSITNILKLAGYIMIFSIISGLIFHYTATFPMLQVILSCILEITSGIKNVAFLIPASSIRYPIILAANALGGISCLMQTGIFLHSANLSIKKYMYHKIRFTMLTLFLWYLTTHVL